MITTLAFLSGKGGSGKTTLALSMSHLLCKCNIHVLLVDCDMSTNGATYFYESRLSKKNEKEQHQITSFNDLLNSEKSIDKLIPFKINQNLDFIPSSLKYEEKTFTDTNILNGQLQKFINYTQSKYDVVLFDCQAGYTSLLQVLLPLMDIDLFVLETDSISGSSMRNLYLKIGQFLGNAHLYQVFNKATDEEFEIYSKIVGTFFTNIGTLLFDWRIRQAFSRSQVPDMDNTSSKYGADLCDICKIIFYDKELQKNLQQFSNKLYAQKLEEEYEQTEKKLSDLNEELSAYTKNKIFRLVPQMLYITFPIIIFLLQEHLSSNPNNIIAIIVVMFSALIVFSDINDNKTNNITKSKILMEQRKNENKIKFLSKKMKELNN